MYIEDEFRYFNWFYTLVTISGVCLFFVINVKRSVSKNINGDSLAKYRGILEPLKVI